MGPQTELRCTDCARADTLFSSSMASAFEQSLVKAGWAWSPELLKAVVSDLRNVGIPDAPHMIGERAARHGLHFCGAHVLLFVPGIRLSDFPESEQWPEDIKRFMDKLFRVSLFRALCVFSILFSGLAGAIL